MKYIKITGKIIWNILSVVILLICKLFSVLLYFPIHFIRWLFTAMDGFLTFIGRILALLSIVLYIFCHVNGIFKALNDGYNIFYHGLWIICSLLMASVPLWTKCFVALMKKSECFCSFIFTQIPVDFFTMCIKKDFTFRYDFKNNNLYNDFKSNNPKIANDFESTDAPQQDHSEVNIESSSDKTTLNLFNFKVKNKKEYNRPEFTAEKYMLKKFFWDGNKSDSGNKFLEATVYDLLRKNISDEYLIIPHVSLREIFFVRESEHKYPYLAYLSTHHVDFLFIDSEAAKPVAAIELDGVYHIENEKQIKSDLFKNSLFEQEGIPLLRIPLEEDLLNIKYYAALFDRNNLSLPVYHKPCYARMLLGKEDSGESFYFCPVCTDQTGRPRNIPFHQVPNIFKDTLKSEL